MEIGDLIHRQMTIFGIEATAEALMTQLTAEELTSIATAVTHEVFHNHSIISSDHSGEKNLSSIWLKDIEQA